MFPILNVIAPVFAIVITGYLAVRLRLFPREGVRGLISFVNNFATPCLLFEAMITSDFSSTFSIAVIGPFYFGAIASFVLGIVLAIRVFGTRPGEGVASGFSGMFTNTVLIGIPIVHRAYGDAAMPVVFSIIALHAALLITLGMLTMELVRRDGTPLHRALGVAVIRIGQNPLLWGVGLGLIANRLGIDPIEPVEDFLTIMAAAVLPVALFGLGGALNDYRLAESWQQALVLSLLKLLVQPAVAWVLMVPLLRVDPAIARYAVLLAAMPSGINVFVFATYYNRGVNVASNTVLISTGLSVLTVSGWLYFLSL